MPREERERRFISEYMLEAFPQGDFQINVELGPIPQELTQQLGPALARRVFRPSRPRVDAVAWWPGAYFLVEAKVREPKAGIGDLLMYASLVPRTEDLPGYEGQPLRLQLVVPQVLDWVREAARDRGIEVVEFWRDWIADYWQERQRYFTGEYRRAREEKLNMRRILGLE